MSRSAMPLGVLGLALDLPSEQQVGCKPQRRPYLPHEQQKSHAVQTLEAERTFMMMIAKTKGMSPGISQAQKTFTSCRHRAGHQQFPRTSCGPSITLLRQWAQHRPAGDEAGRCSPVHRQRLAKRAPCAGQQTKAQSHEQQDFASRWYT